MQADHSKIAGRRAAGNRRLLCLLAAATSRFLSAVVAICAAWPLLLLAAEPVKPDAPVQQEPPLDAGALMRTKVVPADYPDLALRHGMECVVTLRFTVLPDGSTADIEVVHSDPVPLFALFEESAIRAVKQWRYEPVIRKGQPVAQKVEARIRFVP